MDVKSSSADFTRNFDVEHAALKELAANPSNHGAVLARLSTLEKGVSDAAVFLPAYDVRRCLALIADLNATLVAEKNRARPKFSFAGKAKGKLPTAPKEQPLNLSNASVLEPAVATVDVQPPSTATVFANLSNLLLRPTPSSLNAAGNDSSGAEVYLSNLSDCLVDLRVICPVGAVHIKNASNCIILCGGIKGSVLIDGMKQCILVSACRQFRMHNSSKSRIFLHVSSKPIIEDCQTLVFGPYLASTLVEDIPSTSESLVLPSWLEIVNSAELGQEEGCGGRWCQVDDFNWLRKGESPNWRKAENATESVNAVNEFTVSLSHELTVSLTETSKVTK